MKIIFLFSCALWALNGVWAKTSYVPATQVLHEKGYQLSLGADVFQTEQVINSDGTSHDLSEDQSYTRYQAEVGAKYGITNALQFGMGARFRHHESNFLNSDGDKVVATNSGIQSIATNLSYAFQPVGSLKYALEGLFRYTPYTNEEFNANSSQTKLILGDDGNEYEAGMAVTYSFKNQNFFTARSGYRNPGQDLSSEIYWQGEGAMVWNNVALVAGVDGISSLKKDPYTQLNRPVYNTGASGLYGSSNREVIAPYVGLNLALSDSWRLEFKGSQVVYGSSTDKGRSYGLQLIRRVEQNPSKLVDTRFKSYDLEATVTKVSPKKGYLIIDKGISDNIQKGMSMDFYEFDYVGGNVLVARGTVISTKSTTAVVKITQRFNQKKEIKAGLIGRSSLK